MSFVNNYKPPTAPSPDANRNTPAEAYDFNYFFEPKLLKSDRVELRPFVVRIQKNSWDEAECVAIASCAVSGQFVDFQPGHFDFPAVQH